jgi:hypothetical protein
MTATSISRSGAYEPFGWFKAVGGLRKTRHRGRDSAEFFVLTENAYNLIRTIFAAAEGVFLEDGK